MATKIDYINPITKDTDLSSGVSKNRTFHYEYNPVHNIDTLHTGIDYITKNTFNKQHTEGKSPNKIKLPEDIPHVMNVEW